MKFPEETEETNLKNLPKETLPDLPQETTETLQIQVSEIGHTMIKNEETTSNSSSEIGHAMIKYEEKNVEKEKLETTISVKDYMEEVIEKLKLIDHFSKLKEENEKLQKKLHTKEIVNIWYTDFNLIPRRK